jgi:uncharacterized membrane protein YdjX (TVP38/TMEM64 family)
MPITGSPRLRNMLPLALVAVLAAVVVLAYTFGLQEELGDQLVSNRAALRSFVAGNFALALALYFIIYVIAGALSLPGASVLSLAGSFLFGWFAGGTATLFAATLGATLLFLIVRSSFGPALAGRGGARLSRLAEGFSRHAFSYLLFLRLVPLFPFFLVNIAPALAKVSLKTFVTATFIGIIPGTYAFAFVGAGLDEVLARQEELRNQCLAANPQGPCPLDFSPGMLVTPELLIGLTVLGVIALLPLFFRSGREAA